MASESEVPKAEELTHILGDGTKVAPYLVAGAQGYIVHLGGETALNPGPIEGGIPVWIDANGKIHRGSAVPIERAKHPQTAHSFPVRPAAEGKEPIAPNPSSSPLNDPMVMNKLLAIANTAGNRLEASEPKLAIPKANAGPSDNPPLDGRQTTGPYQASALKSLWRWLNRDSGFYSLLAVILLILVINGLVQSRGSWSCTIGWTSCVFSQGKMIPSETVLEILRDCDDFTRQELGLTALTLSLKEILERNKSSSNPTGMRSSPLLRAYLANSSLYDSALPFDRKWTSPWHRYTEIEQSCRELRRDFHDDTKWTR